MITTSESASLLYAAIRPHILVPDHVSESEILIAIRAHLDAERHQMAQHIAKQATSIIEDGD